MDESDHTVIASIPDIEGQDNEKQPYILFQQGPLFGKMVLLQSGSITLGRADEADLTIKDEGISRKHIQLTFNNGKTIARDLKSTNGSFVNGDRISETELRHEDKLQISNSTIIKYIYADKLDESTQKELYDMGHRDPLTNAYNKRHLMDRLREEFSFAQRRSNPLSLIMYDVDHFKLVNDTHGHQAGDFVLMHLAKLSQSIIREEDVFARYGGEEFTILLKDTDKEGGKILADRLRQLVEEHKFVFEGAHIPITISVGVATLNSQSYPDDSSLMAAADKCLYTSKEGGRNRVTCA